MKVKVAEGQIEKKCYLAKPLFIYNIGFKFYLLGNAYIRKLF